MDLEMVLNELSLRPLASDVQVARQRMSNLVSTIAAATKLGVGRVLRTHRDFNSEEIAPGYPVAKWRNDHEVDREARSASYASIMGHYGEHIQQIWPDGSSIDVNQQMTNLTMSIIGKALFDADVFTETDELGAAMTVATEYVAHASSRLLPPPYSWPTPRNRRTRKAIQVLRNRIQRFIDERRNNQTERNDFLSILLQARDEDGQPMSDEQLMAECMI